jgi:sialate O-acetylesterase
MKKILFFVSLLASVNFFYANVRLPKLVSDGMILQRNTKVKIWGWADSQEKITVDFKNQSFKTVSDNLGNWSVELPNLEAGGPFQMMIKGSNVLIVNDIWIGDVWVCSGQSNMELPMYRVKPKYEDEIAHANYPQIRMFTVPQSFNFKDKQTDFSAGEWKKTTPENVLNFSAVAYFFAKELHLKYKIPIGLIHSSLGGSPAQAWMSEETLKQFPNYHEELQRFKSDSLIQKIESDDRNRIGGWYAEADAKDLGHFSTPWNSDKYDFSDWKTMQIPGFWAEQTPIGKTNGVVWFKKEVELPANYIGKAAQLNLGAIFDADSVWVNGVFVGNTTYLYPPRWYKIPENVLKKGKNVITIRIVSERDNGGFALDKKYEIKFGNESIDLSGEWKYKLGTEMPRLDYQTFVRWKSGGLYNTMLAPILNYAIKGVIWYQGESNVWNPKEYQTLFPALINNWRSDWNQGDFPFLYVQLSNFLKASELPVESNWAALREAQSMALNVENTAMALTMDIGEWNDIHPLNKQDVGKRLALCAYKVAYNELLVYSGPSYASATVKGKKMILTFNNCGTGLEMKGEKLNHFAIAGEDKTFVWANAKIKGNKVIVWSNAVKKPKAVRYAWADNPQGANLYNKEGLPALSFRSDDW